MEQIVPLTEAGKAIVKCAGKSEECNNCVVRERCNEIWGVPENSQSQDLRQQLALKDFLD